MILMREDVDLEYKYYYNMFNFPVDKEHCMRYINAIQNVENINIERISVSNRDENGETKNYSIEEFQYVDDVNEFIREYRNKYITYVDICGTLYGNYFYVKINLETYIFTLKILRDSEIQVERFIDDIERQIKWEYF